MNDSNSSRHADSPKPEGEYGFRRQPSTPATIAVAALVLVAGWSAYSALCAGWRAEAAAEMAAKAEREREAAMETARSATRAMRIDADAREAAEDRAHRATVLRLATQGKAALDKAPQRALLLAAEAADLDLQRGRPMDPRVESVLRDGLAIVGGETFLDRAQWPPDCHVRAISPDRRWVVSSNGKLWDLKSLDKVSKPLTVFGPTLSSVAFSANSKRLAIVTSRTVKVWDIATGDRPVLFLTAGVTAMPEVPVVELSSRGRWLAIAGKFGTVHLWDLSETKPHQTERSFSRSNDSSRVLAFSADEKWLASGHSLEARLWNLSVPSDKGEPLPVSGLRPLVVGLKFSWDLRWLVTLTDSQKMQFWSLSEKKIGGQSADIWQVEKPTLPLLLSPDGNWLACSATARTSGDTATSLLPIPPWTQGRREYKLPNSGTPTVFSDNGKALVTNRDGLWLAWEIPASNTRGTEYPTGVTLGRHNGTAGLNSPVLSPNGKQLVTYGDDPEIRIWKLNVERFSQPRTALSEAEFQSLRGHDGPVERVIHSSDEAWLVSFADGEPPRRWNARELVGDKTRVLTFSTDELLPLARRAAGRELTAAERKEFLLD